MSDYFWLREAQFERIKPYFPLSHGAPRVDDRRVVSGIIHVIRNGLRWRDAPEVYAHTRLDLLKEVVNYPYTIPGLSDGGAHTKFFCGGRYPTEFLASFTRDQGMLTLEEAHWKLSTWPATCAGLSDRGVLREGYAADIVMYDYDGLGIEPSMVVHDLLGGEWRRVQRARGYRYIMVNGEVTFVDGQPTKVTPGLLLRRGNGWNTPHLRRAI